MEVAGLAPLSGASDSDAQMKKPPLFNRLVGGKTRRFPDTGVGRHIIGS